MRTGESHPHSVPLKKPLPDLRPLGPPPAKPPRPPVVDFVRYYIVNGTVCEHTLILSVFLGLALL